MGSPVSRSKDPSVPEKLERFSHSWKRYSSMLRIVSSTLLRQPSQLPDGHQHTVWLLDNTAYRHPASHVSGEPHSWRVEVVACVFRKDSRRDISKFVAVIADLVGLDGELGTEKEIRRRIARRLQPFLYHIVPEHYMMLEIPLPNHTTQIHKIGPTEENGIVSQVINTGVRQVADGARVRSHIRGVREKAYMETAFAGPEGWLVVSDVDDTIKYTKTSDTTGILRTTFAEEPRPITGMPQLYSRLERHFEPTWFYLSASPYNLYPFLRGFLRDHFSPGTLILRDSSWLDISELVKSFTVNTLEYKVDRIRKIRRWFPHRRALCIGDSTQTDPEAYAEIYRRHPEWVHAILIRKVMDVPHMEEQNSPARFAEAFKGPAKRRSTTMDEQTFVPDTMRALYWSPASTALLDDTSLDEPRVDSEVVFDTNFPTPKPSPRQYLIKVQTAAFSLDELRVSKAKNPSKSIPQVPVHNFCGTIISTPTDDHEKPDGPKFKVDEAVFGLISYSADGAAADYVLATEDQIAHKPKNISAAEAATIPLPALTAWQALFKYAGLDSGKHNKETRRKLRILITDARPSEVGTQALHLLRSPDLFPHHPPWICATCASKDEEEMLRNEFKVDETILAPEPAPKDFDLTSIFRKNKWDPVDVVLDYTGEDILRQANNPAIVKDGGAVLTAVDANPVFNIVPKGKDGEGPSTKFVSVEPDGKTLGRISKMVEDNIVRGRVETVIDLVDGAEFLSSDAPAGGGRSRGGIFVFRVNP
ncbi:hypothetical protein BJX68DRAFT_252595 [Aspergillus pseudodeflectus]|uniref:Enoyl reductase (ER) domain-containing protein n=1 Tax=Aspergillus pseudodeflectus TaxID=176178 RepID=A0ABR4L2E1_9EURO